MYIYRYKILLFLALVFIFSKVNSQNIGFDSLKLQEDTLQIYFDSLAKEKDDSLKFKLNNKIIETFQQVFSNKESFEYVFNIRHIGILKATDNSLRFIIGIFP